MSTVCILTPMVIGSWPMIASAVAAAASTLGYAVSSESENLGERKVSASVETEIPNSEVIAEALERGQSIRIEKPGVRIEFGIDERGACRVCVRGEHDKASLRKIGEEVAGRVVQQFAYHKLMSELKARHYEVVQEDLAHDHSIQVRVKLGR